MRTELEAARAEVARLAAELKATRRQLGRALPRGPSYAWCRNFLASTMPSLRRKEFSKQRLWQYEAVAKLPISMGEALDAAGLGFAILRYVAGAHDGLERQLRFEEVLRLGRRPDRPLRLDDLTPEERRDLLEKTIAATAGCGMPGWVSRTRRGPQ